MEELTGNPSESRLKKELGQLYPYMKELQSLSGMKGVQARLPFVLNIQ